MNNLKHFVFSVYELIKIGLIIACMFFIPLETIPFFVFFTNIIFLPKMINDYFFGTKYLHNPYKKGQWMLSGVVNFFVIIFSFVLVFPIAIKTLVIYKPWKKIESTATNEHQEYTQEVGEVSSSVKLVPTEDIVTTPLDTIKSVLVGEVVGGNKRVETVKKDVDI